MAANIGEIRAKVSARIKDVTTKLSVTPDITCDVDRAILAALEQYSKARPHNKTAKVTGTGAFDYPAVTALSGFVDGFSVVTDVAYPYVAATDQNLNVLEREEWALVRLDTGLQLRFFVARPAATEFFLAAYTAAHSLTASTSTVPATDDEALADLGAAYACDFLAALYAQEADSSIGADSVDRRTKSDSYRSMAASYRKSYSIKMEIDTGAQQAAFATAELDRFFSNSAGTDYFFHGRRRL